MYTYAYTYAYIHKRVKEWRETDEREGKIERERKIVL